MYDRHKRVHGLWASEGHLWEISPFPAAGNPVCVYGDPAHPLRIHLQAPYCQGHLTQQMEDYNKAMSEVQVSMKWFFEDIINSFKFLNLDYRKKSKDRSKQHRKNASCMSFAAKWHNLFILYSDV